MAISYASDYLTQHADGLRIDWPHVPLPAETADLLRSAEWGRTIASLLDPEAEIPGQIGDVVNSGLLSIAPISRVDGAVLKPEDEDLAVTGGWGHFGKDNAVMPGRGRVVSRAYTEGEHASMRICAEKLEMEPASVRSLLGEETLDIWLNEVAYWRNVPRRVWDLRIGGYQVIKKWLSYREQSVLGRGLRAEEAREVSTMARRIAGLVLLEPALNANYKGILAHGVWAWRRPEPVKLTPKGKPTRKRKETAVQGKHGDGVSSAN